MNRNVELISILKDFSIPQHAKEFIEKNNKELYKLFVSKESILKSYLDLDLSSKFVKKMFKKDLDEFIKVFKLCDTYLSRHNLKILK